MTSIYILCLILVIVLFRVLRKFYHKKNIGWLGEKAIARELMKLPDEYTIFNNVYLTGNNKSVQIDHIVFSPYGIFVIETKRYRGKIYGGNYTEYWTKYNFGREYKFYNPILQNYGHVRTLKSKLNFQLDYFIPIVVFTGNAILKVESTLHVINQEQLLQTILKYQDVILQDNDLQKAMVKLSYSSFTTSETATEHIESVKSKIQTHDMAIMSGVCPRCSGHLVYRNGKFGPFMGCSNYPNCKFTAKCQI